MKTGNSITKFIKRAIVSHRIACLSLLLKPNRYHNLLNSFQYYSRKLANKNFYQLRPKFDEFDNTQLLDKYESN